MCHLHGNVAAAHDPSAPLSIATKRESIIPFNSFGKKAYISYTFPGLHFFYPGVFVLHLSYLIFNTRKVHASWRIVHLNLTYPNVGEKNRIEAFDPLSTADGQRENHLAST